ncbi:hypothetical protein Adt_39520 [Abeliophyllum distichum]|uniref:Uncharacterized protein n=1 Tax=Abeliophyllum distichum TaxID=126358 RepID=A0ABD1Q8D8_9LAMI
MNVHATFSDVMKNTSGTRDTTWDTTSRRCCTLLDVWQDVAEIVYELLWSLAIPILPLKIDYEAFCAELTIVWKEAQDDALEFFEAERVPSDMRIGEDTSLPISDVEE